MSKLIRRLMVRGKVAIPEIHPGSRIPDLGSRIQQQQQKMRGKTIICLASFLATNIRNIKLFLFQEKNLSQFTKNYSTFNPKNCHYALKNIDLGSGIQNP